MFALNASKEGREKAANIPKSAITITSSIKVKPHWRNGAQLGLFIGTTGFRGSKSIVIRHSIKVVAF
jgi:hypothetical protein